MRGRRSRTAASRGGDADALRVLVLDHTGELGGAELALVRLAGALGPEVSLRVLLFSDGPLVDRLREAGVAVQILPLDAETVAVGRSDVGSASRGQIAALLRVLPFTWRLVRQVRALRPDVLHTTSLKADLLGVAPALATRTPLVWHVHDRIAEDYLPARVVGALRWASTRLPSAIVVNSQATAATLPGPTTVAYPGFVPEQVQGAGVRERRPPAKSPVVGMIGRISPTKGQLELVRAAPAVLARHRGTTFRIVGEPSFGGEDYAVAVRAEAEALGVADRFVWAGFTGRPEHELDGFSVCVHASPTPEPFGQVVVEAMVRGVPVVATRAGGVTEILAPAHEAPGVVEDLGVLVAPGDVDALAAAIVDVLDDPVAASERAERARRDALFRFPVERTARVVTEVWRQVARPRR